MLSRGLILTTLHDAVGARRALDAAMTHVPRDTDLRQHRLALEMDP